MDLHLTKEECEFLNRVFTRAIELALLTKNHSPEIKMPVLLSDEEKTTAKKILAKLEVG
jgi:hypothetical protein